MKSIYSLFISFLLISVPCRGMADPFDEYAAASATYKRLVAEAALRNQLPRLSDPAVAEVLSVLTDHKRFLLGQDLKVADLQKLSEMCSVTANASAAYYSFGVLNLPIESGPPRKKLSAEQSKQLDTNFSIYRDEIIKLEPFIQRCSSKAVSLIQLYVLGATEMDRDQIRHLAQVQYQTFSRFLVIAGLVADVSLDMQIRKRLLDIMIEVSPSVIAVLTPPHRLSLIRYLEPIGDEMQDEMRSSIEEIVEALKPDPCVGMCDLRKFAPTDQQRR